MRLVHYQTIEAVEEVEFRALNRIKSLFNERRSFCGRIKLWRKSDILDGLSPEDARWGFTKVCDEDDRCRVLSAIRWMSRATPRLTWVLYDEGNGGDEVVLRGGRCVA